MKTRCKFRCNAVTDHGLTKDAVLTPVVSGKSAENEGFWKATPSGELRLTWLNPDVNFVPGQEYYLDITAAPPPEAR